MSALVGNRVYPGVLTQSVTYPAITYQLLGREYFRRLYPRGSSFAKSLFSFYCVQKSTSATATVKRVAQAVWACLDDYSGTVYDLTVSPPTSIDILGIRPDRVFDLTHDETETYQVIAQFEVSHGVPSLGA